MELGLGLTARLDPWQLAHRLDIPVLALSDLSEHAPGAVRHFQQVGAAEFSAVTVFRGSRRVVVYNDAHSRGRQASNVGHELAHGLLLHEPSPRSTTTGAVCGTPSWRRRQTGWPARSSSPTRRRFRSPPAGCPSTSPRSATG
jgi:hypothetical protein